MSKALAHALGGYVITLTAPQTIKNSEPIEVTFTSQRRVSGRVRLTEGDTQLNFILEREGRDPVVGSASRVRGKTGQFTITEWAAKATGAEVVVRFEGAKAWIKVVDE